MSNRRLIVDFAAHLAHLLNINFEARQSAERLSWNALPFTASRRTVRIEPGMLYARLLHTLQQRKYRGITGAALFASGGDIEADWEAAAVLFFDNTLGRRLKLARDGHLHKGHDLFLALCRRGAARGWAAARLARSTAVSGDTPADLDSVSARLASVISAHDPPISPGNPAKSTREAFGPPFLSAGQLVEVPEEMSVWDAIACSPSEQLPLEKGKPFDAFVSTVIKAVETANAHYGTLVSLGLSPTEWLALPINTAKAASAFMSDVRGRVEASRREQVAAFPLEVWKKVWEVRQVPGYDSAGQLWNSPLGQALRNWLIYTGETGETPVDGEYIETFSEFEATLNYLVEAGAIEEFDKWVYTKLYMGWSLAELAAAKEVKRRFKTRVKEQLKLRMDEVAARVTAASKSNLDHSDIE